MLMFPIYSSIKSFGSRFENVLQYCLSLTCNIRAIYVSLTCSSQCRRLVQQKLSMCCHFYVIMHVKDNYLSVVRVGHYILLAGLCLSLYGLYVLNREFLMIQTKNKHTNSPPQWSLCIGKLATATLLRVCLFISC